MDEVDVINMNSDKQSSTAVIEEDVENPPNAGDGFIFQELFAGNSLLELSSSFWKPSPLAKTNVQPYLRGCKWSPDGTCCLSVVNHDGFHIMDLPRDLYEDSPSSNRMISYLPSVVHVKEGGEAYDFCWYPKMNSYIPETCSWITTKKNSPIQMWDAYNGSLRCSYRGYNAVDEMEPALSVTFINDGARIVGGYRNSLKTFDVERPGRDFTEHKIKSTASCLATTDNLLAVGSWNANIKLFSINDLGKYGSIGNMHGHKGGITHMQFTPDRTKLVSGARKDSKLLVWDLRFYRTPLNILHRCVLTNQRIYFDVSSCGRYLVSGGSDGVLRVWDDEHSKWTGKLNVNSMEDNVTFRFCLYQDSCNSVSIHPSRPIIATGSGQFHFVDPIKVLDQESDDEKLLFSPNTSQFEINDTPKEISSDLNKKIIHSSNENKIDVQKPSNNGKSCTTNLTDVIKDDSKNTEQSTSNQLVGKKDERECCEEPPAKRAAIESVTGYPIAIPVTIGDNSCKCGDMDKSDRADAADGETSNVIDSTNILNKEVIIEEQIREEENIELFQKSNCVKETQKKGDEILSESTDGEEGTPKKPLCSRSVVINDPDRLPIEAHKIVTIKESTTKPELDGSKQSCAKDSYAKEMLYSCYAENNLNFWWIAGIPDVVSV